MGNSEFKRAFFFWLEKLQISKKERISITIMFVVIVLLLLSNVFINDQIVPPPENHDQLLAEFERRSALVKSKTDEMEKKYNPGLLPEKEDLEMSKETTVQNEKRISINEATIDEFIKLPGIGSTYAQRIIEYRETNGSFTSVEDLVKVRGIGDKTLEKLKPYIKL